MAARHCPSWADLHPELVGLILGRLPSLADRVRLGAVCRPWRRAARQEPLPPPLPWLSLRDGTFLSVSGGGEIHRVLPEDAYLHGSVGDWLFLEPLHTDELALMDPFSGHVVWLPDETNVCPEDSMFFKLVPLSTPSNVSYSDFLLALLITSESNESVISICWPSAATAFAVPEGIRVLDIAFFDGKLYALSRDKLFSFVQIGSSYKGNPRTPTMECVADAIDDTRTILRSIDNKMHACAYCSYLVESTGGKLLLVRRQICCLSTLPDYLMMNNSRTLSFQVFELGLLATDSRQKWTRLNTLGDQALFVGTNSKSLPASKCGAQEDCIYFVYDYDHRYRAVDALQDCGVFNMRNGLITPLLTDTMVVRPQGCRGRPTWFFPC